MTAKRILIAGYGELGRPLGETLIEAGHTVFGLRRRGVKPDAGVVSIQADLRNTEALHTVLPRDLDCVYIILTPDQRDEAGYRAAYLEALGNLLSALRRSDNARARVVFVSSTAVYGQTDGRWVDELSPTQPTRFNGACLLKAEQLIAEHTGDAVRVRFGGIYGPGREALIARVKEAKPCQTNPVRYTNRIHSDDCVGLLAHVGDLPDPPKVIIGVDDNPCPQCEVMDWLATALGVERPPRQSGGLAGRRCDNARLKASGYRLKFPSFEHGYQSVLADPRCKL